MACKSSAEVPAAGGVATAVATAQEVAAVWLKNVDRSAYGESWDCSALSFQRTVSKEQWVKQLGTVRAPLGHTQTRTVRSAKHATELLGAPHGDYVIISYDTQFSNKETAIETVTPMRDEDGVWRVSGYHIR